MQVNATDLPLFDIAATLRIDVFCGDKPMRMLILDTETTGFDGDAICWQVGLIMTSVNLSKRRIRVIFEQEITLAYMPEEIPRHCFNGRPMFEAFQPIRDSAYEYAREVMCGEYDPAEFRLHMSEFLYADREQKVETVGKTLSKCDVWAAWNLNFDHRTLLKLFDDYRVTFDESVHSFCLLEAYRKRYPSRRGRLVDVCSSMGINVEAARVHTALYDAQLALQVLKCLCAESFDIIRSIRRSA